LNAFASITAGPHQVGGALGGLPYAAKDIFRTPGHEPTCGFAVTGDMGIVETSDLLARLNAVGADFVGFTNLPELPMSRPMERGARSRAQPVESAMHLGRLFVRVSRSGGQRIGRAALGSDTGGSLRIPAHAAR